MAKRDPPRKGPGSLRRAAEARLGSARHRAAAVSDADPRRLLHELEVHQIRAMPPHERAARFRSARLQRRLTGAAERTALTQMGIPPRASRRVYEIAIDSCEVKAKVGEHRAAFGQGSAGKAAVRGQRYSDDRFERLDHGTIGARQPDRVEHVALLREQ